MADAIEDLDGGLPCPAGGLTVTYIVMGVSEGGERGCFVVGVGEVPVQVDAVLIAGDGLPVVAEVAVGVAQAVPGGRYGIAIIEFLREDQCFFAVGNGSFVVAEQCVTPADAIEQSGRLEPVLRGPDEFKGALHGVERVGGATLPLGQPGENLKGGSRPAGSPTAANMYGIVQAVGE